MHTTITGFHQDAQAEWVAQLQCGHTQHMRHRPPWQERAWVQSEAGRARHIGQPIDCPLCDMPVLPARVQVYKRTADFTEQTIPAGLLKDHTTKPGVWARIVVSAGELEYSFGEPRRSFVRPHPSLITDRTQFAWNEPTRPYTQVCRAFKTQRNARGAQRRRGTSAPRRIAWWHERCVSTSHERESECFRSTRECAVNQIIYIIGLVVVVVAVLSWLGLR